MQQLICPECGGSVTADNINIQKMTAVCAACDTVFQFDTPEAATPKAKRRKVRQPQHLALQENGDTLRMAFRTNWRLDQESEVQGLGTAAVVMLLASIVSLGDLFAGEAASLAPTLIFGLLTGIVVYMIGLRLYNQTHIDMDADVIRVSRQPLPSLRSEIHNISLSGVTAIIAEETKASIEKEYDTPRFAIWAVRADGTRRLIVTDLVEDYAYFVAQQLDQSLHADDLVDTTRLLDGEDIARLDQGDAQAHRARQLSAGR